MEMGFDSLMLVNLMNKLSECFSMEMTIAVFYEFETVNKLTDYFFIKLNK
ncbi:acyl carrier protein [Candidatus Dependentiae bacterium]|nr:acyl carrier protein [Candidatus Dependentiae bacterium]